MRLVRFGVVLGAACILGACSSDAAGDHGEATLQDEMFLTSALSHVQSEIALAKVAETEAKTPALRTYAHHLADDRAPLWDKLNAAAKGTGAAVDLNHAPQPDALKGLSGEDFERGYLALQLEDQQNAIDEFGFAAQTSGNPGLRKLASDSLPQLKEDLANARDIVDQIPFAPPATDENGTPLQDTPRITSGLPSTYAFPDAHPNVPRTDRSPP